MPLLNYTTQISVFKTVGEIQEILVKHGATKIRQDYENGSIKVLFFSINTPNGEQAVKFPVNADKVLMVLKKQGVKCDMAQAQRVAWRIAKTWVEAQMAILESAMVTMDEIFFPYITNGNGDTLYSLFVNNQLSLAGGNEEI